MRASDALQCSSTRRSTLLLVRPFALNKRLPWLLLTSRSVSPRRPFRHKARSPRVRTHAFTAQPPDLHHFALATRASRLHARSPCSAVPRIRLLFIGSRFTLHASSPRSVALAQLRFTSFAVASSREDLHLQVCARAGRTRQTPPKAGFGLVRQAMQCVLRAAGRDLLRRYPRHEPGRYFAGIPLFPAGPQTHLVTCLPVSAAVSAVVSLT